MERKPSNKQKSYFLHCVLISHMMINLFPATIYPCTSVAYPCQFNTSFNIFNYLEKCSLFKPFIAELLDSFILSLFNQIFVNRLLHYFNRIKLSLRNTDRHKSLSLWPDWEEKGHAEYRIKNQKYFQRYSDIVYARHKERMLMPSIWTLLITSTATFLVRCTCSWLDCCRNLLTSVTASTFVLLQSLLRRAVRLILLKHKPALIAPGSLRAPAFTQSKSNGP